MRQSTKIAAFASLLLLSTNAMAQMDQPLPLEAQVRYGKLDNGLTYYIRHSEEPRERVNFYIAQKVGSVQEEEEQRGLAHFLEHMCFNGSKHYEGNALITYCESIGVKFGRNLNAYTSTDETVYNIDDVPVTSGHIDSCLLILRDWSDGLLLLPEEIQKERGVIHEEWRMRTSAAMRIYERNLETLYPGSRYGRRMPIGLMSVVDNFEPQVLRNYYEKWYRPDLQGVIVVGDIDVDDVEKRIIKTFSDITMPENAAKFEYYEVPNNNEPIYVLDKDKEQTQNIVEIIFKSDGLTRDQLATSMLFVNNYVNSVMCGALNARLSELSKNPDCPFIAAEADYSNYLLSKTKDCFEVGLVAKKGQTKEAIKVVMTEVERARRFGFVGTEIYRARQQFMSSAERTFDNRDKMKNSYHVRKLVRRFLDNNAVPGIELEYQLYKMLDKQIPNELFSQVIKEYTASIDTNFVVMGMFPEDEVIPSVDEVKQIVTNSRSMELTAYVDNVKDEPLIAKLPKKGSIKKESASDYGYTMWTLSNGARVFYKKTDFSNTQILLSAQSFGGQRVVDSKYTIAAKVFDDVMGSTGLGNFTITELEKKLAGKQVSIGANLGFYTENLRGSATPKDLRTLFELIYMQFQEPANDVDGYNSCINELRLALENKEKNPMASFNDSIYATLYSHNPLFMSLTLDELNAVNYEDVRTLYKQRFKSASDFDFFFTGNIDVDSLRLFTEQYIASLPNNLKKREVASKTQDITYFHGDVMNRYERTMETPQAYLLQFWHGDNTYSLKTALTASAAGQILTKRYLKSIREDGGMAYSVSSSASSSRTSTDTYNVQIVCPFTPAKCDSVLLLIEADIDNIARDGVTENELDVVRKYEQKHYTDNQRENGYWQNLIIDKVLWNAERWNDFESTLNSINSDDVKNFIAKMKKDGNRATVIILPDDFTEKTE
ncbi:MAG: insulinase family protein [Bacteroidales bacterium]|jgi:zinc protease|nr:insulinase family protein [Bacteroidales bacterium]